MKNTPRSGKLSKEFETSAVRKMSLVGILGNIALTCFKLFAGITGHSGAMVSDALHSFSDVFATLIALLGVRLSRRGPDAAHPYGHERFESLASLALGWILLRTGLMIGKCGLERIFSGDPASLQVPSAIALAAALVSILTKEGMFWYTRYYAKLLGSPAFLADAWHHRSDAFSSVGSLIGIAGAMLGFPVLDSVASVVICLCILKVACGILRDALREMLDTSCGAAYEETLRSLVLSHQAVQGIGLLHTRRFGSKVCVDLEIALDGSQSLAQAHRTVGDIQASIEARFADIRHIMVRPAPAAAQTAGASLVATKNALAKPPHAGV